MSAGAHRPEESILSLGAEIKGANLLWCREPDSDPPEEQQAFPTLELSLQLHVRKNSPRWRSRKTSAVVPVWSALKWVEPSKEPSLLTVLLDGFPRETVSLCLHVWVQNGEPIQLSLGFWHFHSCFSE